MSRKLTSDSGPEAGTTVCARAKLLVIARYCGPHAGMLVEGQFADSVAEPDPHLLAV
jgi:hypothetical protein